MSAPSRRALLRLRLDDLLGTRPGDAVVQRPATSASSSSCSSSKGADPLPGCSAERGHDEGPPPWRRPSHGTDHD